MRIRRTALSIASSTLGSEGQIHHDLSVCNGIRKTEVQASRSVPLSGTRFGYDSVTTDGQATPREEAPEGQARPTATPRHAPASPVRYHPHLPRPAPDRRSHGRRDG